MLRMFRFSKDFGEKMVYPLVALFFGVFFRGILTSLID